VFRDLKTRGCQDILIAVTDGLKGMGEALAAVYPATTLQTCLVHLIRQSLDFANWKQRKLLAAALRPIYTAPPAEAARAALETFERGPWGVEFPTIGASWRRVWTHVIPFFAFPPEVPAHDRHDQRARERARAAAEDHQNARPLSEL
jgi:transposase-like protein